MAFLTIEDLVGTVEVIVFPRIIRRKNAPLLTGGCQDFCGGTGVWRGEKASKLIWRRIVPL